jgi:tetratricopeptide (TPR) repeat protein
VREVGGWRGESRSGYRSLFVLAVSLFAGSLLLGLVEGVRQWQAPPPIWFDPMLFAKKLRAEGDLARAEREFRGASLVDRGIVATTAPLADIYRSTGDTGAVIRTYQDRVSRRPFEAGTRLELARSLLEAGHVDEGIATLEALRRLAPRYPGLLESLGIAYLHAGRNAEAEVVFREGLRTDPMSSTLHLGLGLSLEQLGDLGGAEVAIERALRIDPGNDEARANLQRLHDRRVYGPGT